MRKIIILWLALGVCSVINAKNTVPCQAWLSQVDPSIQYSGYKIDIIKISNEDKMKGIECLLKLENQKKPAKISGATSEDSSYIYPTPSVEVAALWYIRYIYLCNWQHSDGIALYDSAGEFNSPSAVAKAYKSYKKWFNRVKKVGITQALKEKLDPMDDCKGVRWV